MPTALKVFKAGDRGTELYDRRKLAKTLSWVNGSHKIPYRKREEILLEIEYNLLRLVKDNVTSATLAELLYKGLVRRTPDAARRFADRYLDADGEIHFDKKHNSFPLPAEGSNGHSQIGLFAGNGQPGIPDKESASRAEDAAAGEILRAERERLRDPRPDVREEEAANERDMGRK